MVAQPTTPTEARPETWQAWQPPGTLEPDPGELLTRDEFLAALRERGVDVSERTLVHWESAGALPRPVRRWRDGAPRALYAPWLIPLASQVRDLQEHDGLSLHEIGSRLRPFRSVAVQDEAAIKTDETVRVDKHEAAEERRDIAVQASAARGFASAPAPTVVVSVTPPAATGRVAAPAPIPLKGSAHMELTAHGTLTVRAAVIPEDLESALAALARRHGRVTGTRVERVEVHLTDDTGTTTTYRFPPPNE